VKNGVVVFAVPVHLALKFELSDAVVLPILIGAFDGKANL
jgi:hypothetical protein